MKRTKKKKQPDLILTGDWHLRETVPVARTDNFWKAEWGKIRFIKDLQEEYNCPIIQSGDVFDHWKASPYLLSETIKNMPEDVRCVYGNHDLPQNNLEMHERCGLDTIILAGAIKALSGIHWNQKPRYKPHMLVIKGRKIAVWHIMTWQGKTPWPGCTDPNTKEVLKQIKADLVVTGHNHKTFIDSYHDRLLVNPGSLMRSSADQIDHKPCVFLWYADNNSVKKVFIPIQKDVISREHITTIKERDARIGAFVEKLKMEYDARISFTDNLEAFFRDNTEISKKIESIVWDCLEKL